MSNPASTQDYLNLLTSQHQGRPKLAALIEAMTSPLVTIQNVFESLSTLYDLDAPPSGVFLDAVGQWVGISRSLQIPIPGVFFSWDGTDAVGWDAGIWKDPSNTSSVLVTLPDDVYLTLIKAKIAANHWDGTTEGIYLIWDILFPNLNILIQDDQTMSFSVAIQGTVLDSLTLALLRGGYLPLKPGGVHITSYIVPVDTGPLFGWDVENSFIKGFDEGSFGSELKPS